MSSQELQVKTAYEGLYELGVYSGKKMLFRFRDSLNLLPGKLSELAKNLCPDLGTKGSIPYDEVKPSNLVSMKNSLLDYMKQDIVLLGGVMQKAQEIFWEYFKVDIESKITLASLALSVFRMKYYDEENWPIHIPSKNDLYKACLLRWSHRCLQAIWREPILLRCELSLSLYNEKFPNAWWCSDLAW